MEGIICIWLEETSSPTISLGCAQKSSGEGLLVSWKFGFECLSATPWARSTPSLAEEMSFFLETECLVPPPGPIPRSSFVLAICPGEPSFLLH